MWYCDAQAIALKHNSDTAAPGPLRRGGAGASQVRHRTGAAKRPLSAFCAIASKRTYQLRELVVIRDLPSRMVSEDNCELRRDCRNHSITSTEAFDARDLPRRDLCTAVCRDRIVCTRIHNPRRLDRTTVGAGLVDFAHATVASPAFLSSIRHRDVRSIASTAYQLAQAKR